MFSDLNHLPVQQDIHHFNRYCHACISKAKTAFVSEKLANMLKENNEKRQESFKNPLMVFKGDRDIV